MKRCPVCKEETLNDSELARSSPDHPAQCPSCFSLCAQLCFFNYVGKGIACYNFILLLLMLGIGYWLYAAMLAAVILGSLWSGHRLDVLFFQLNALETERGLARKQKLLTATAVVTGLAAFLVQVNLLPEDPLINLLLGPFILTNY